MKREAPAKQILSPTVPPEYPAVHSLIRPPMIQAIRLIIMVSLDIKGQRKATALFRTLLRGEEIPCRYR